MRLWTIHPKYLDRQGLVALWREGIGALRELERPVERKSNYYKHPQLTPFKNSSQSIPFLKQYLFYVYLEAVNRGYKFNLTKLNMTKYDMKCGIELSTKQIKFEYVHLKDKLMNRRSKLFLRRLPNNFYNMSVNPVFTVIDNDELYWG